jgi:hypothetical protein
MPLDVALFGNHSFNGHQAVTTIVTHPMRGGEGRVAKPGYGCNLRLFNKLQLDFGVPTCLSGLHHAFEGPLGAIQGMPCA